jgi:hypothetical protein
MSEITDYIKQRVNDTTEHDAKFTINVAVGLNCRF